MNFIDSHPHGGFIKINIARIFERLNNIERAVSHVLPTMKTVAADIHAAQTVKMRIHINRTGFQRRQCHHNFEC